MDEREGCITECGFFITLRQKSSLLKNRLLTIKLSFAHIIIDYRELLRRLQ